MSIAYRSIQWNPFKRRYDVALAACVIIYLASFIVVSKFVRRGDHAISDPILLMRAFGTAAFALLNITLCIGPLARLDRRFLPLLYNRRHLGVTTFLLGLIHATLALGFYHGFGRISPIQSLLTSNTQYRSLSGFPFESLGLIGLLILFLMAATSHDFWLKNLSPAVWKSLHMLVYVAWGALVMHVALGAMQRERSVVYTIMMAMCVVIVPAMHTLASRRKTRPAAKPPTEWLDAGAVDQFADGHGKVVTPPAGERIAIFRFGDRLSAMSNTCAHQGGPLGEGRIIDGCLTCPWHGYQYRPEDGCSPPPFTEKLPTFALRIENGRVLVNVNPFPPGAPAMPVSAVESNAELIHA